MGKIETPYDSLTYQVIGLAMNVHNELGPGLYEEMYRRALLILMDENQVHFEREFPINVIFRTKIIGTLKLDLIVEKVLIVELKAISSLAPIHEQQTLTYLSASGLEVALLINFGAGRLEYNRLFPSLAVKESTAYKSRHFKSD